ncbi:Protein trichome birefringence-like 34 [Camellia lanceoleosa]|uniref:Protein trichome birefringence-like 34 n=1 Tax=Camellia lanceoleosa TaxID=1840588 RepID=A0ACC0J044_9ERIC|nr:Protein trichome birefringence-like 34 [Camellia lanceoleosa]
MLRNGHQEVSKNGTGDSLQGCNLFSGKWVYDEKFFPLYKELECSFIDDGMACERFGRKDFNYQHWRWQPHDCDLPRFNAIAMLEKLRGKKLVLSYEILTCTAMAFSCFNAIKEYNASIDFYWAPLLVESNSDDLINHRVLDWIVRVQAIEKHARYWTDADILVFNSYIWWRRPKLKVL